MVAATTSELGRYVRGVTPQFAADSPLDTALVRDGIINNLNHLSDSEGQVLLNLVGVSGPWIDTDPSDDGYQRFPVLPSMRVPLRIRHDESSLRLVVQLRCSAAVAGTVSFLVHVRTTNNVPPVVSPPEPASLYTSVDETSTTSTTGADLSLSALYLTPSQVANVSPVGIAAISDQESTMGDGSTGSARMLIASVEIWAKTSLKAAHPRIHSVMIREYIGKDE